MERRPLRGAPEAIPGFNPRKRKLQRVVLSRLLYNESRRRVEPLRVLCLPGRTGWDAEFFLSFPGVGEVHAVERDASVASSLREKFSSESRVRVHETSTSEFLSKAEDPFHVVYLDYYSTFGSVVRTDLKLLVKRNLLLRRSQLAIAFYASRGPAHERVLQEMEVEDIRDLSGEEVEIGSRSRLLRLAFNSFLCKFRRVPTPLNGNERKYYGFRSPAWYSYEGTPGAMLVAHTALTSVSRSPSKLIWLNLDRWLLRGEFREPRRFEVRRISGGSHGGKRADEVRAYWRARILDFYEKNYFTPSAEDLNASGTHGWRSIVREVGLCPRSGATLEEISGEARRIEARVGYVNSKLLRSAMVLRKLQERGIKLSEFLRDLGISNRRPPGLSQIGQMIQRWVRHLDAGLPRCEFSWYSNVRKLKLLDRAAAVEFIEREFNTT